MSECPADANGKPVDYDTAITSTCAQQGLKTGDLKYGQCLDYLVWEKDHDTSGHNFSKCFYDVTTHALAAIVFDDGMQDECGNHSFTVQTDKAEAYCTISGLTTGGGGYYQSCTPVAEGGSTGEGGSTEGGAATEAGSANEAGMDAAKD
jgi:hypothetical protein